MPPLEPRDHRISVKEAAAHTRRHREQHGRIGEGDQGASFHADQVLALLAQKGCAALRIYYGRNEKGHRSLILVGADAQGRDMEAMICEIGWPCPPFCEDSALTRD